MNWPSAQNINLHCLLSRKTLTNYGSGHKSTVYDRSLLQEDFHLNWPWTINSHYKVNVIECCYNNKTNKFCQPLFIKY